MEACPRLPWAKVAVKVIAESKMKTIYLMQERVTNSWRQHISSAGVPLSSTIEHIKSAWDKCRNIFKEIPPGNI